MALTVTKVFHSTVGDRFLHVYDVTGDSSHAAGGEDLTKAQLGFAPTADPEFDVQVGNSGGYIGEYVVATSKFNAYMQTDSDNNLPLGPADTIDLSAVTFRVRAYGKYPL